MTVAISVEHLSKSYRLGQIGTGTLTNDMKVWWAKKLGRPNPMLKIGQVDHGNTDGETIWALKDVSFQVEQGEVLGIIGRNGAGKSTLLKILSRVTAPSSGFVKVKGRIASLLEVGTGFHPDLTGRENIYLNGAILGMTKQETARKFDEIVAFAEIEKFIDTPVKRYSSGMYVRLAFAVAAHLESEILLVDEVLAVGDAEFQKKCLGKMGDVASREGRTVLFVSHNMESVRRLCINGMVMRKGILLNKSKIDDAIANYMKSGSIGDAHMLFPIDKAKSAQFTSIKLSNIDDIECNQFRQDEIVRISVSICFREKLHACMAAISIISDLGFPIFTTSDWDYLPDLRFCQRLPGKLEYVVMIPEKFLFPGRYFLRLGLGISGHQKYDQIPSTVGFEILSEGSIMAELGDKRIGVVTPMLEWQRKS